MSPSAGSPLDRLSINGMTVDQWSLAELVDGASHAGVRWIAPWRHKLAEEGVEAAAERIQAAGLRVSSLCRGGFFPCRRAAEEERDSDNRLALDEAAGLAAETLVLVCGPPLERDLAGARDSIERGIRRLLPLAAERDVRLGIEPLHPMLVSERSAITSLREAVDLVERIDDANVGVVVDAYHVFWEYELGAQIARAAGRIAGVHVSDWVTPTGDVLAARAMMGDGVIDLAGFVSATSRAGWDGPIEVEVISDALRQLPGEAVLDIVVERFAEMCTAVDVPA